MEASIRRASKAPPIAPSITVILLCFVCFFPGKIVTCGASIEELSEPEKSLHVIVEKDRHRFPDALHKFGASEIEENNVQTMTILISILPNFQAFSVQRLGKNTLQFVIFYIPDECMSVYN